MGMRFRIHGFHILEVLNINLKHFQKRHYQFYVIGTLLPYHDNQEITLEAIIYDEKRKEYQMFNLRSQIISKDHPLNLLFELFLEEIYMNMVFSVETDDNFRSPLTGERIYSFRDLLIGIYKNDRLPKPRKDFDDIYNLEKMFSDGSTDESVETKLKLKSHSE